eukprot:14593919-Heterocapsa_arctica.AAC.1
MEMIAFRRRRLAPVADDVNLQDVVLLLKAKTSIKDLPDGRRQSADCRLRPPCAYSRHTEERDLNSGCCFPASLTLSCPLRRLCGRRQ